MRVCAACLCALMLSSCSFVFVSGPPELGPPGAAVPPASCTTSNAAPVVDSVLAGIQGLGAIGAFTSDEVDDDIRVPLGAGELVIGALFLASAVVGTNRIAACQEYRVAAEEANQSGYASLSSVPVTSTEAPLGPIRSPEIAPQIPNAGEAACTHDAQCETPKICHGGRCVPMKGMP